MPVGTLTAVDGEEAPSPERNDECGEVDEAERGRDASEEDGGPELAVHVDPVGQEVGGERPRDGEQRKGEAQHTKRREAEKARRPQHRPRLGVRMRPVKACSLGSVLGAFLGGSDDLGREALAHIVVVGELGEAVGDGRNIQPVGHR